MITVCSSAANKILKKLSEEKDFLLSAENKEKTYVVYSNETLEEAIIPDYDFETTQFKLEKIEEKILKIKHAINKFNTETEIMDGLTIDMALVKMSMLSKRLLTLKEMCNTQKVTNGSSYSSETYRKYANFDIDVVKIKYELVSKELSELQLALDKVNMIKTFDIDIDE